MGWYERIREVNSQRGVLEGILALLLLMASLADHAAGLPLRRRRAVLGILACGEAEARGLVLSMAAGAPACGGDAGPQPAPLEGADSSVALMVSREPVERSNHMVSREPVERSNHEDAARLAAGLRLLALALSILLARARRVPLRGEARRQAGPSPRKQAGSIHPPREAPALAAPDTS